MEWLKGVWVMAAAGWPEDKKRNADAKHYQLKTMNIYVFYDTDNDKYIVCQVKEVFSLRQVKKKLRLQCLNKQLFT